MRYKTFIKLVQTGALVVVVGAGYAMFRMNQRIEEPIESASPVAESPLPASPASATPTIDLPFGEPDQAALTFRHSQVPGGKIKDAFKDKRYKISAFQDPGKKECNRVKLDLDRDNKWDEKWTFDKDEVKREISPLDDENYPSEYRLSDGGWRRKR